MAAQTETLLNGETDAAGSGNKGSGEVRIPVEPVSIDGWRMLMGRIIHRIRDGLAGWWTWASQGVNGEVTNAHSCDNTDQNLLGEEFTAKKAFCQDLEKRGLLDVLCSGSPEQLGFSFD